MDQENLGPRPDNFREPQPERKSGRLRVALWVFAGLVAVAAFGAAGLWSAYTWTYAGIETVRVKLPAPPEKKITQAKLDEANKKLSDKLAAMEPKGVNVVVDTAANRLYLRDGTRVQREAIVSCGSGNILPNPNGKEWVFDSPRGEREVLKKIKNPVWAKPDWAFVEEGKPIPPRNDPDRIETGVLGDYAFSLGNGFLLHGTLYKRMLGRNVTHGCVRIGDEDLEHLFQTVPVGTKVYFY